MKRPKVQVLEESTLGECIDDCPYNTRHLLKTVFKIYVKNIGYVAEFENKND